VVPRTHWAGARVAEIYADIVEDFEMGNFGE
jgi:hypothetical protein